MLQGRANAFKEELMLSKKSLCFQSRANAFKEELMLSKKS